jgi:hypothetical protein
MTLDPRAVRLFAAAAAGLVLAGLAGCGWTARDEYLRGRSESVSAHPGDGSYLASDWNAGRRRTQHTAEVASRFEDPN